MTPRMTVALAVLTLGLALAALAGIPALIENRAVGDVVVVIGFAVAVVGLTLVCAAVPEQRRETKKLSANDGVEVDKLRAERRRLLSIKEWTSEALQSAKSRVSRSMSTPITLGGSASDPARLWAEVDKLTTALIEIDAAIEMNAAEFKRYGIADLDSDGIARGRATNRRSRPPVPAERGR